jgi:hypothetical protein
MRDRADRLSLVMGILFAAILGCCAPAPSAASPSLPVSASPSATATARTPLPVPAPPASDLVVRIEHLSDVCCPSAALVLMVDGRLVTRTNDNRLVERRLTAAGAQQVRDEIVRSGLFANDQNIALELKPGATPPGGGVGGVTVRAWNGARATTVMSPVIAPSLEPYYQPSSERRRIEQLVARLLALETWLPASAWDRSTAELYSASAFRLIVNREPVGGSPPDVSTVDWPFTTPLSDFGEPLSPDSGVIVPVGPGPLRCAALVAADAQEVRNALARAGATINEFNGFFTTVLAAGSSPGIVLFMGALMPDQASCAGY